MRSIRSAGRAKLPTKVVRIRSVLRFIAFLLLSQPVLDRRIATGTLAVTDLKACPKSLYSPSHKGGKRRCLGLLRHPLSLPLDRYDAVYPVFRACYSMGATDGSSRAGSRRCGDRVSGEP
jgi:hypothetical protein